MNKNLIVIVGPTAIGKTSLSIALAKYFDCEIVSADSRQFYREMSIGTAAPTIKELKEAKHHFIQHKSIKEEYSVGDFERDALTKLTELFKHNDYAILIGGSGLYINAVTNGLDHFPETGIEIRKKLQEEYTNKGIENLQQQLKILDPEYYNKVDLYNTHRVMRALEVCISTGLPYSSFLKKPKKKRPFQVIKIGITADREVIYERINKRVDLMIEGGLVNEVKNLYNYKTLNALNTVGYKEIFKYLDNEWSIDFAISEIKKNTRRFAKRQLTWFKKDIEIEWFGYKKNNTSIITYIKKKSL
ncbi:tRNA (adenosine(37)-N6)-dimethylallyltransferase MiaA [Aquimarina muelleri]|uniref:tRNA dimethylallyltransferase n=1 Tax=Aquimarina muelleri TaxID=279356 RepID=A0A918N5C3_9FLAO|nr:tRNA (adenosine(37)-N6)-dimethylallyltransferase MiaA [Aquimarina muelleri]MCX2763401.1 tRNA (adenosine(37)-N6)-dimethylallyltransferase MiaA [Aquimarina muelleri]GGX28840.1 tRNA dimethylallyltransferase [Aquimarina muelleri]